MNFVRKQLAFFIILAFAGCSGAAVQQAAQPHFFYVPPEQVSYAEFTPPPAPDSDAQKADLAAVLDWQAKRTREDCAKANETARLDYEYFWGARNLFPEPLPRKVKNFFQQVGTDLGNSVGAMKDLYRRPRPAAAYPGQAEPCVDGGGFAYPSGHAAFSRVFALVLADIIPELKDEFFAKADQVALDRVIGGVHFPTDIAAGKLLGDQFHAELLKSPRYLKDVEKMRAYLVKDAVTTAK